MTHVHPVPFCTTYLHTLLLPPPLYILLCLHTLLTHPSYTPFYTLLGHGARNVVEGGLGLSWPYIGGWELNARGLNIGMPMPDTLSVNFTEQVDYAPIPLGCYDVML